jgi:hypothetical protein
VAYSNFPKKKNTVFIRALMLRFPFIHIDLGRKKGYSIYLPEYPKKRWMMIDMNDVPDTNDTAHLFVCIDVHHEDFSNELLSTYLDFPLNMYSNKMIQTEYWMNTNNDAIHFHFCDDDYRDYDFEDKRFSELLDKAHASFLKRQQKYLY